MKRWAISLMVMVALLVTAIPLVSGEGLTGGNTSGDMVGPATDGGWTQVNTDGFGDPENHSVASLAVFGNYLYAGTTNGPTGGELWRSSDGTIWTQVNTDGFGDAKNDSVPSLAVFGNYLYAGTSNWSVRDVDGGEVWRSSDGTTWTQVNTTGFGNPYNHSVYSLAVFGNYLYAGTFNWPFDEAVWPAAEMWRTPDGTTWTQISTNGFGDNASVSSLAVFGNYLYAGTGNPRAGCEVWRSSDGTTWTQVNTTGFGNWYNHSVLSLGVFANYLYAGTYSPYIGGKMWRTPDGTTWSQVNTDAFYDPYYEAVHSLAVFGNYLYAGTMKYSTGGEVWRSFDGTTWTQVNSDGFGDPKNYAVELAVFGNYLYAGTSNESTGAEIWRIHILSDISPGDWFYDAVMNLYNRGIIAGYPDGTFGPSNQVTRAEFATMLVRAMGWAIDTSGADFPDVPSTHWAYGFVKTARNHAMVSGYPDGTFRPDNPISRAEIATMIVRAMGWTIDTMNTDFPDVPPTHWAYGFIKTARNHGVVSGYPDGTFKPDNPSTRAEAAAMIYRALP